MEIILAKVLKNALTICGREGSTFPGRAANKIFDVNLEKYKDRFKKIVLVTGTNGKTTTTHLIANTLSQIGTVITNRSGANLRSGITTAILLSQGYFKKKEYDFAVLEVDESRIGTMTEKLKPDYIVFTNLSMDQVDRHNSTLMLSQKISNQLQKKPKTKVIVNGNDLFAVNATKNSKQIKVNTLRSKRKINQRIECPNCNNSLEIFKASILIQGGKNGLKGDFTCQTCGLNSESDSTIIESIKWDESGPLTFKYKEQKIASDLYGEYNKENLILAIALFEELKLSPRKIKEGLQINIDIFGRNQRFEKKGKRFILNLVKNPVSFNEQLKEMNKENPDTLILLFNNELSDGKDTDWLNSLELKMIEEVEDLNKIYIGGKLATQLKERLEFLRERGISLLPYEKVEKIFEEPEEKIFVLANYSALNLFKEELTDFLKGEGKI